MSQSDYLFQKGVDYFNSGYYFEAHDTFEELWMHGRQDASKFYQGLVQLATVVTIW
jgi:predicted metal-dependent hydrolase